MLSDAIGDLLPAAVAVALSPIPIVAVVLVLGSRHARSAGPAFAAGWVAGLAAVATVVVLVLPGGSGGGEEPGVTWLKLAIGVLFLVMAARQWQKRPREGREPELPGWMATIDTATAPRALLLGLGLSAANPKNLALTLAAAASIAESGLGAADEAIAVAVFVAIGSLTVLGAVLAHAVGGDRATQPLAAIRAFMATNNAVIMMVVLLILGVKFIGDAVGGF